MKQQEQRGEGQQVEDRADEPEDNHVAPDLRDVPALRVCHALNVDAVGRDGHGRHVGEKVVEQDLFREERQERQERRRERHTDHVPEVRARRDHDVLERVCERAAPIFHPRAQHVEVALQQDDVRALACDVHSLIDRDADVGRMQCRRVVDPVAEVADRVPRVLQREHDAFLLLRIDLGEERHPRRPLPERLIRECREHVPCDHRRRVEPDHLGKVARDEAVVPRDDLDLDVESCEVGEHARRIGLGRIEKEQEAREDHRRFVVALIGPLG